MAVIINNMLWVPVYCLDGDQVKRDLTVFAQGFKGSRTKVVLWRQSADGLFLGVPRAWGMRKLGWLAKDEKISNRTVLPEKEWPGLVFPEGWDYWKGQENGIKSITRVLAEENKLGALMQSGCGTGKTAMSLDVASRLHTPTLIVVHKGDLAKQWHDTAKKLFPGATYGHIQGGSWDWEGKHFVTAMAQTLHARKDELPEGFISSFGLVIYDEGHRYPARTFERVLSLFNCRHRLAVSATWYRTDKLECLWHWHVGDIEHVVRADRLIGDYVQVPWSTSCTDRMMKVGHDIRHSNWIESISVNAPYNKWLTERMAEGAKTGRRILCVSDRRAHLEDLRGRLLRKGKGYSVGLYVGGEKAGSLKSATECTIILATYGMMCIQEDEIIVDPISGQGQKIKNTVDGFPVISYDKAGHVIASTGGDYISGGTKPCVKISHTLGACKVSTDHPMLTSEDWQAAGDLTLGSWLIAPRQISIREKDIPESNMDMWLLGILIGDGCLVQKGTVELTSDDEEIVILADSILGLHNMELKKSRHQHYCTRLLSRKGMHPREKAWIISTLERYDLRTLSKCKRLHPALIHAPRSKVAHLLAGLIDSDGYVSKKGILGFSSSSKALVNQVVFLLQRLGLCPSKVERSVDMYGVRLSRTEASIAAALIPLKLTRKRKNLCVGTRIPVSKLDSVPANLVKQIKQVCKDSGVGIKEVEHWLKGHNFSVSWWRQGDIGSYRALQQMLKDFKLSYELPNVRFVPIQEILDLGNRKVGDITVPRLSNFTLSGVIVHNSEGSDIPALDTLILSTPRARIEQIVGRLQRPEDKKRRLLIVDPVFQTPYNMALGRKRLKTYQKLDFVQHRKFITREK